jgi:hypothetical protein
VFRLAFPIHVYTEQRFQARAEHVLLRKPGTLHSVIRHRPDTVTSPQGALLTSDLVSCFCLHSWALFFFWTPMGQAETSGDWRSCLAPKRQLHSHGSIPWLLQPLRTAAPTAAGLQSVAFPLFKLNKAASSIDLYLGHHRLAQRMQRRRDGKHHLTRHAL